MSTYQEYDDMLSQYLMDSISGNTGNVKSDSLEDLVNDLVAAIPYYSNPDIRKAHTDAIGTEMALQLPNYEVAPEPDRQEGVATYEYYYEGGYDGYRSAFYHGVESTTVQQKLAAGVLEADPSLDDNWWARFSVAILTDACDREVSVSVNSGNLADALSDFDLQFRIALPPSYLPIFTDGYGPTKDAYAAIQATGQMAEAAQILDEGISSEHFRTNFNTIINQPGDGKDAATWFLFNNWIALKALGYPDVDAAIATHEDEGLVVPDQLGPVNWWTGHYHDWFARLNGDIVVGPAKSMITAVFEETQRSYYPGHGYNNTTVKPANGYAHSLCEWGDLAYY